MSDMNTDTPTEVRKIIAGLDRDERAALAERDRTPGGGYDAESALRSELADVERELAVTRQARDDAEDRIRLLVFRVETLTQAVGVFNRRAAKAATGDDQ